MDERVWVVVGLIAAAGIVGGVSAYFSDTAIKKTDARAAIRYMLLGVVASACVPLFLSLVQSQLLKTMFTASLDTAGRRFDNYYEAYLVFVGICLLAAFSARKFIDSISKQVLQRLEEVQDKADEASATATAAREVAVEAAGELEAADQDRDPASPPDDEREAYVRPLEAGESLNLGENERAVLIALSKRTYRTGSGVAADSGVSRNQVSEILDTLYARKLAFPTKSPSTGGTRWIISERGRSVLKGM